MLLDFCFGELALLPDVFWEQRPADIFRMIRGYQRRELNQWRQTRWLGTLLVNINRAPDTEPFEQAEILPLPGDPRPEAPREYTPEETAAQLAALAALDADLLAPNPA